MTTRTLPLALNDEEAARAAAARALNNEMAKPHDPFCMASEVKEAMARHPDDDGQDVKITPEKKPNPWSLLTVMRRVEKLVAPLSPTDRAIVLAYLRRGEQP